MRTVIAALSGGLFGAGLHISGMTDTARVKGFLDFFGAWDPTLAFVMGGAMIPMIIAWRMTADRTPLVGGDFPPLPSSAITARLAIGSLLFGLGWGLVGLCPGPAIASLSYGGTSGALFAVSMLAGMMIAPRVGPLLDSSPAAA